MREPILLTPGPLTTTAATRSAMLIDWGSWDSAFNELTASVCRDLTEVVNGADTYVCVPLQGSGTFSVEAAIGTLHARARYWCRTTAPIANAWYESSPT